MLLLCGETDVESAIERKLEKNEMLAVQGQESIFLDANAHHPSIATEPEL